MSRLSDLRMVMVVPVRRVFPTIPEYTICSKVPRIGYGVTADSYKYNGMVMYYSVHSFLLSNNNLANQHENLSK